MTLLSKISSIKGGACFRGYQKIDFFEDFFGKERNIRLKRNFQGLFLYISTVFSNFFKKIHVILCLVQAFRRGASSVHLSCGGKDAGRNFHLKQRTQIFFYVSIV